MIYRRLLLLLVLVFLGLCYTINAGLFVGISWHDTEEFDLTKRGFISRICEHEGQSSRKYLVFLPHVEPPHGASKYPVILFLNGLGEKGDNGLSQISNNFGRPIWEMQETFPFIAVMPQCPLESKWVSKRGMQIAMDTLDEVIRDYPADPERVAITGPSAGGSAAIELALEYPKTFSAVVSVSGSARRDPQAVAKELRQKSVALWMAYNQRDNPALVQSCRRFEKALYSEGCDFRTVAYDRSGHDAWNFAYRDPSLYEWVSRKCVRNKINPITIFDSAESSFQLSENDRIEFEATLAEPVELEVSGDGIERDPIGIFKISSINWNFKNEVSNETLSDGSRTIDFGALTARTCIREGEWNHVSIKLSNSSLSVEVNGVGYAVVEVSDETTADSKSLRLSIANGDDRSLIRHLRVSGGDREQSQRATNPHDSSFVPHSLISNLQLKKSIPELPTSSPSNVYPRMRGNKLQWEVSPLFSTSSYRSELAFSENDILFSTSRQWLGVKQQVASRFVGVSVPLEFLRAQSGGFNVAQPSVARWFPVNRRVSGNQWEDEWQLPGGEMTVNEYFSKLDDAAAAVRLTREDKVRYQLNTLHMQAATIGLGGLPKATIPVNPGSFEPTGRVELVGDRLCDLYQERVGELTRRFWFDRERSGLVCRFQGHVPLAEDDYVLKRYLPLPTMLGDTLIEIKYERDSDEVSGWVVASCMTPESPIVHCEYATVLRINPNSLTSKPGKEHETGNK